MNGMGSHQSARMKNDEWLTPPEIIRSLSQFDLDPCSPVNRPWPTALHHFTKQDDGLQKDWFGRVWLNPPYGLEASAWLNRLASHGDGVALIFARTETRMFFDFVWNRADAVFFFDGRLFFYDVQGIKAKANAGAPSCLVAFGEFNVEALRNCGIKGKLLILNHLTQK